MSSMVIKAACLAMVASAPLVLQVHADAMPDYELEDDVDIGGAPAEVLDDPAPVDDVPVPDNDDGDEPVTEPIVAPMMPTEADQPEVMGPTEADQPEAMEPTEADQPEADTPAGQPEEVAEMWEQCVAQLGAGNATNSLEDILTGAFEDSTGEPSVFIPLLEDVDAETLDILTAFDLSGDGYTLILPPNEARDYNASGAEATAPVFEVYDFDPNATTPAEITEVVRAHIIPGTLTFVNIVAALEDNGTYAVTSLQGYKWVFALASGGELVEDGAAVPAIAPADGNTPDAASGGTYPVLLDNHNITTRGFFDIQADISGAQGQCPNSIIISVNGFFAAPQYLTAPAEAPARAPTPEPASVPDALPEEPLTPDAEVPAPDGADPLVPTDPDGLDSDPDGGAEAPTEGSHAHGAAARGIATAGAAGVAMFVLAMA
eukprot:jgi/Ulvmu1/7733/UM039_0040.1